MTVSHISFWRNIGIQVLLPVKGGVYLDTEFKKALQVTEKIQQYDENIKLILSQKIILAHILTGVVTEFKGWKPEEVIPYIEGEPQVSGIFVEPGLTNKRSKIQGSNTEDNVPGEGRVTYDIKFYVRYPNRKAIGEWIKYVCIRQNIVKILF